MTMNWENLNDDLCPYCGQKLLFDGTTVLCSSCKFTIDPNRFKKIRENRRGGIKGVEMKMRWQNLKVERCPQCGELLKEGTTPGYLICVAEPKCPFKILQDKMLEYLADPLHATNQHPL